MQSTRSKHPGRLVPLVLALSTPALHGRQGPASDPVEVMTERTAALGALAVSEENAALLGGDGREGEAAQLRLAETALARGDWLGSLRPYARVASALAQVQVVFETDPIEDLEDLAIEHRALRDLLQEIGSPSAARDRRPAALQALLEYAHATAAAYLSSAGEQGREGSLRAGIYYLKVGRAHAELAQLLAGLNCAPPAYPLGNAPGLSAYLDRLEAELLELYRPPLTQERHATFIGLSAGLKFAREMRDNDHQLGALEEGLGVARGLALFPGGMDGATADRQALRKELERWQEQLGEVRGTDVSLPAMWLRQARHDLADESADPRGVAVLFERILPDYFACFEEVAPDEPAAEARVTVTLVRWPFT